MINLVGASEVTSEPLSPRERFIAALERRPLMGRVPHFELVFFLTMETFGKVHPLHRSYGQWFQMDKDDPLAGFQKRIAPASMFAMIAAYCMEWIQPSEHHDLPIALQLMAVYSGGLMLTIFFAFGKIGVRFPLLSSFGKNLLIMFALGGFVVR